MEYKKLTEEIIGCAFRVYNIMGFGFLESVYQNCMMIELNKLGINPEAEKPISVTYENDIVGEFKADILVNKSVIVELKSVKKIVVAHEIQLVNYLTATGMPVGLLLNFGENKVDVKRKLKSLTN